MAIDQSKDAAYVQHTLDYGATPMDPGQSFPAGAARMVPSGAMDLGTHRPAAGIGPGGHLPVTSKDIGVTDKRVPYLADPASLGLAGFAATTFVLSAHNAGWAPDIAWVGLGLFYGGLAQLLAGMWDFRNNNTFGATCFSTYGGFWFSLATYIILDLLGLIPAGQNVSDSLGWFLVAFFIFNTYAMVGSFFLAKATLMVFITLEVTLLLLFVGFFKHNTAGHGWTAVGGYFGVLTALFAWYNSAAVLINRAATVHFMPVGAPVANIEKLRAWHARRKRIPESQDVYNSSTRDSSI